MPLRFVYARKCHDIVEEFGESTLKCNRRMGTCLYVAGCADEQLKSRIVSIATSGPLSSDENGMVEWLGRPPASQGSLQLWSNAEKRNHRPRSLRYVIFIGCVEVMGNERLL